MQCYFGIILSYAIILVHYPAKLWLLPTGIKQQSTPHYLRTLGTIFCIENLIIYTSILILNYLTQILQNSFIVEVSIKKPTQLFLYKQRLPITT